jgi:hypothetical protein
MAIAPAFTVMATSKQSQQTSDPTNPATERASPTLTYWAKAYGGTEYDCAYSVQQTSDGGYIVAGFTESFGWGGWLLKLDSAGSVIWQKVYEGSFSSVQQTADGGYIVAGSTKSFGAGGWDFWVLKLNSTGGVEWQKTYGGNSTDWAQSVQQTADGGYIVAGSTTSFHVVGADVWVLKLSSTGGVMWQKTYGGSGDDQACSIQQTADGGYTVAGITNSFGVVSAHTRALKLDSYSPSPPNHPPPPPMGFDVWVLKLDSTGSVVWQKTYGGTSDDEANCVEQTSDGGCVVAGYTRSYGGWDDWVLKLGSSGSVEWQKTYGGDFGSGANCIEQTPDGGYIVAGFTGLSSVPLLEKLGGFWVLKLDSSGSVEWQETYGGGYPDQAGSVQQTSDGGYIVGGITYSFGAGNGDAWVLKLNSTGGVTWNSGSNASTQATNAVPSDSNAAISSTPVTPADSAATVEDTHVTPQDTNATVTVQASPGGGRTGQGIPLTVIVVGVAVVLVVVVVLVAAVLAEKKRSPTGDS